MCPTGPQDGAVPMFKFTETCACVVLAAKSMIAAAINFSVLIFFKFNCNYLF